MTPAQMTERLNIMEKYIIHKKNENLVGLRYFRSINHKIYILTQIPEIIPPNLLHCGHNLTCDRLLMLPGTIT